MSWRCRNRIAVILTVFNRREKTVGCLRHLFEAARAYESGIANPRQLSLAVFMTDDGCTDGTAEAVRREFPAQDIHIVQGDGNLYWAGGMRKAWQAAIESGIANPRQQWDYFLLINDDTYIYNNVFGQLFEAIDYGYRQTGRRGMASGITCQPGRPQEITYGGLNFVNKTRGRQELVKPTGRPQHIDMTHANILLLHHTVVDEIGIFHKGYTHSGADNDYSMTATRHGLPVYSTSEVCGACERDHYSMKEEAQMLMRLSLAERKKYVGSPLHSDRDYLLLVRRNMPLRYPMARLMRALRLYMPKVYYRITNLRGVYKTACTLLALLPALTAQAGAFVYSIDSQERFEQMNAVLTKAIADGETDIVFDIARGVYYFRENHLIRRYENSPDVTVRIQGHDAVLIAGGNDYHNGDSLQETFNPDAAFIDTGSLTPLDFWDHCRYAEDMVEVVDEEAKRCRLRVSEGVTSLDASPLYINIPQWYYSGTYKVERVEKSFLYFTVPSLKYVERGERREYNVNYDYIFGGLDIRYRLCSPPMADGKWSTGKAIHECRKRCFLYCKDTAYKSLTLTGLRFLGNSSENFLIKLDSLVTDSFSISDCRFEAIKNYVLWANATPNISFSQNIVEHCNNGVSTSNSCVNTRVVGNSFRDCGENMMQTFCVNCKGKDYYIAHNKFCNYGYAAVGVGLWYGLEKIHESSGVIEYNEMWLDPDYIAHKERYTLQDTGALYISPKNDRVTARYNYIHDIDGMLLNRGIFCDDGASHFSVYGNVIINVANSYSIESRNCENKFLGANIDNRVEHNIVDRAIKFEGSSVGADPVSASDNHCVVSGNVMLCRDGEAPPVNVYSRLRTESADQRATYYGHDQDGIVMDRRQMERLRKQPHGDSAIKAAKWRYK